MKVLQYHIVYRDDEGKTVPTTVRCRQEHYFAQDCTGPLRHLVQYGPSTTKIQNCNRSISRHRVRQLNFLEHLSEHLKRETGSEERDFRDPSETKKSAFGKN